MTMEHLLGRSTLGMDRGVDEFSASSRMDEPLMCGAGHWLPTVQGGRCKV